MVRPVSMQLERQREDQFQRERMLLRMRPTIARAIARRFPTAGSAAVEEAVDEALAQIVRAGSYVGHPEQVEATWLVWARCRPSMNAG